MKIPQVYRAQTLMSEETGARPLRSQLSSSAMEAPGQAIAAVGNELAQKGLSLLQKEVKMRRASNQLAAENEFKKKMYDHEIRASSMDDPEKARAYINREAAKLRQNMKMLTGTFDSVTKRRIDASLSSETMLIMARSRAESRKRMVSGHIANSLTQVDGMIKEYATATPARRKIIKAEIFGQAAQLDPQTQQTLAPVEGILPRLVSLGYVMPEQERKLALGYKQELSEGDVNQELLEASEAGDPGAAERVYQELRGTKKYGDLAPDRRLELAEEALRLSDRLMKRKVTESDRKITRNKKARTEKHRTNYATTAAKIAEHRLDPNKPLPKVSHITGMLKTDGISSTQHDQLINLLNDVGKTVQIDNTWIGATIKSINSAQTHEDLNKIQTEVINALGTKIDTSELQMLENRIAGKRNNTIQHQQTAAFENVLEQYVKQQGFLDKILPGSSVRGQIVLQNFQAKIADGGTTPLQAFKEAINAFKATPNLRQIPQPLYGPPRLDPILGGPEAGIKNIEEWTATDADVAIADVQRKFTGKPRTLAAQLGTLFLIKKYLESQSINDGDANAAMSDAEFLNDQGNLRR
jgi:hypothetical protein